MTAKTLTCTTLLCAAAIMPCLRVTGQETLVLTNAQTAVLDPANWDKTYAGERYFDALRPLLVRHPGAAAAINDKIRQGMRIAKIELILTWERQEGSRPERGRSGWGADEQYRDSPGKWSAEMRPLLRPWDTTDNHAPTFNAFLDGVACWSRGGGNGDGSDRLATVFGPLALHAQERNAAFDLTPLLNDKAYGKTPGERLRRLEECGVQIYKHELYDMSYRSFYAYDWAVSTGYIRIWVKKPELRVIFESDPAARALTLPPPADLAVLARKRAADKKENLAPVRIPADHDARVAQLLARPDGLPDWQWQHIQELRALHDDPSDSILYLGRGVNYSAFLSSNPSNYFGALKNLMAMPPRTWQGHLTSDFAILASGYNTILPPAALDYLKLYWRAWLMPEIAEPFDEFLGGGSHRGGSTYFRGYTRSMGTMNFTHNANMSALLGGQFLESEAVIANARHGIENILLRAHVFANGAHQEIGDTYYQALTIGAAGGLVKYAAHPFDHLMGTILRDRLVEPLVSMYHPGLRRMVHPMGRGSFTYHLLLQEGSYHVLHTLSPSGALINLQDLKPQKVNTPITWGEVHGLSILGNEGPPERMGLLAPWVAVPLAADIATVTDGKSFPWQIFARDSSPGCRANGWHVNTLGRNYALASRDNANYDYGVTSVAAQWRHKAEQVATVDDLATMILGFSFNEHFSRELASTGAFGILQAGGKLLALKELPDLSLGAFKADSGGIKSLHASAMLLALGDTARREVWINDRRCDELSGARENPGGDWRKNLGGEPVLFANDGDRITINDGATYIALIPVAINPLQRDHQVSISINYPVLMINAHIYRADQPLSAETLAAAAPPPSAGFAVEIADADDYPDFAAFRAHIAASTIQITWNSDKNFASFNWRNGNDTMEMDYDPRRHPAIDRRVNGKWPYLAEGIERSSPWAEQGHAGRIEKNGVTLETEPQRTAYIQVLPDHSAVLAYNPLPDPTLWRLTLPGGRILTADGRLGLARVIVRPAENRLWVEHAARPGAVPTPDNATALLAFGWEKPPQVELNGVPLRHSPQKIRINDNHAWLIPLDDKIRPDTRAVIARYELFKGKYTAIANTWLTDWHVAGPFAADFNQVNEPENNVDLQSSYKGLEGRDVRWQKVGAELLNDHGGIDLAAHFRPDSLQTAYAFTEVESPEERDATLFFGSPSDAAVWLNGRLVFSHRRYYRVFLPDQDRVPVRLQKGRNTILVKVGRNWESWAFSLRLADANGLPLE